METKTIRTHVILPVEIVAEIDRLAGPRKRSELIAELLTSALKSRRQLDALQELLAHGPFEWTIPGEDTSDAAAYISRVRREESEAAWAKGWGRYEDQSPDPA